VWNENFRLEDSSQVSLEIQVLHDDGKLGKQKCLGVVVIPLQLVQSTEIDDWFDLEKVKDKDKVGGKIHIQLKMLTGAEVVLSSSKKDKSRKFTRLSAKEAAELSEMSESHDVSESQASEYDKTEISEGGTKHKKKKFSFTKKIKEKKEKNSESKSHVSTYSSSHTDKKKQKHLGIKNLTRKLSQRKKKKKI